MADVVENRVVEMQFDNKDFEKNAATSLSTLDKLKEALQFKNSSQGFKEIQNGIKAIDFSPIQSSLASIEENFTTLAGRIKVNFFDEIARNVVNLGTQLYNNTLGQIKSGGQRRAMNIEQAKFKIKGLGEDWDTVYKDMDYAVSGTAYGIDQAANAASQFLASGVKTGDDMKAALRGISGIAAMTSADYDEIANIFTAAAGKGKVQAMELNRISQRGVNAAAAIAKQLGTTEEAVRDMASKGTLDFNTFATAMDSAFGEHAKKANETFTGSLSNMKAALSRIGELFYAPYLENMIPVFNRLRETIDKFKNAMKEPMNDKKESVATRIADLYKNLSDLFIAWSDTWEPALSRLPKRMEKWFEALGFINKKLQVVKDILVDVGGGLKKTIKDSSSDLSKLTEQEEQAARDIWLLGNWGNGEERRKNLEAAGMSYERVQAVVEKIVAGTYDWTKWLSKAVGLSEDSEESQSIHWNAVKAVTTAYENAKNVVNTLQIAMQKIWKIFRAVGQAAITVWSDTKNIMNKELGTPLTEAINLVKTFLKNFKIAGDRFKYIRSAFKGLFSIFELGKYIVASFFKALTPVFGELAKGEPVILKMAGGIGEMVYAFVQAIISGDKIPALMTKIAGVIKTVIETVTKLITGKTSFKDIFVDVITGLKTFIQSLIGESNELETPLDDIFNKVKTFVTKIIDIIGKTLFGEEFSFSDWFKGIFKKEDEEGSGEKKGIIATISEKISALEVDFSGLWENCKKFITSIGEGISGIWELLKTQIGNISEMFTSIFKFITRMFDLGTQNADGMQQNFQAFADFISVCFITAKEIVWAIKDPLVAIAKSVADMIAGIANMFAGITNWIGNDPEQAYGAAAFFALLKVIEKIIDYKKDLKVKDSILYNIAVFFDDMKTTLDDWKKEKLWRVFEIIGNTMIKIAIAMAIIVLALSGALTGGNSREAQDAALQGFLYLFAFLASIYAMMALSQNVFSKPLDLGFLTTVFTSLSTALLIISLGMAVIMSSAKGLTAGQMFTLMGMMLLIIVALFAGIAAIVYEVSSMTIDEKKMATVTAFITGVASAIKKLMKAISKVFAIVIAAVLIQGNDPMAWDNAFMALTLTTLMVGAIILALTGGLAILFTQGSKIPGEKQLLSLAAVMYVFAMCVNRIIMSTSILVGLMAVTDKEMVLTAIAFVTAIMLVLMGVVGVLMLTADKASSSGNLLESMLGIAAVILVLGRAVMSIAEAAAVLALAGVTEQQLKAVIVIVGILSALMAVIAILGTSGAGAGGAGLLAFAGGILAIAVAIYVINAAILKLVEAVVLIIGTFIALSQVWPSISSNAKKMVVDIREPLLAFIKLIGEAIVTLCEVILEAAPLVGKAIATVIVTVIEVSWGYIPGVVDSFLRMLDQVLDLLLAGAETILPKAIALLLAFIAYVDANALLLGYLLGDVLCKIVWGALMALGDFLTDTVLPWLSDKIDALIHEGLSGLSDKITDAMMSDEEVVNDDRIVLEQTTEVNVKTGTHYRYFNPRTGKYYDTYEEAENAELDEGLAAMKEKRGIDYTVKSPDIDVDVERTTTIRNTVEKYEEKSGYKYQDGSKLKESAGDAASVLKDTIGSKFKLSGKSNGQQYNEGLNEGLAENTVDQNAYIKGLQNQDAMAKEAGKKNGSAWATGQVDGAKEILNGSMDMSSIMPEMDMSQFNNEDLMKNFMGADAYAQFGDKMNIEGVANITPELDENGQPIMDDIYSGNAKLSVDNDAYNSVVQQNTDTNKEQISMLEKVKTALDDLKTNLKDCVILPKGTQLDITSTIDKQVLGETMTPVIDVIQGRNLQKASRWKK